jgi:hypothetical protein
MKTIDELARQVLLYGEYEVVDLGGLKRRSWVKVHVQHNKSRISNERIVHACQTSSMGTR